ncbi:MAG: 30S ribosomal protein S12 methylthiotransferase RimO [Ignavibacteria bacterium]|nr:30S ribosomal protein S12 methylthiotransferase RimO [Ignavibacteria bacterium]
MKVKTKNKKLNIITLGCSKNIYDSELLMAQLKANDFDVSHEDDYSDAKTVIINTCGFIEKAKQESINTILFWADAKKKGKVEKVYVTGCLSERYKPELRKEIPDIDEYFGNRELPRLLRTLGADYKKELIGERLLATPSHYAYFKISEGCDRKCSFCAIPLIRGKHISIPEKELLRQAESLAAKGVKELIIIAQDITLYGLDIYGKRTLPGLLEKLCRTEGIEWIRLHYAYPQGFPEELIALMASEQKICRYLDIPLQHISNKILKSMRRGTTRERTNELISKIRNKIPDIALRTTFILGYPGETEEDFEELKEWISEIRFDRLGVFTYSHEENTHAYQLKDNVPERIKKKRAGEIMKLQKKISFQKNKKYIGRNMKAIVDRKDGEYYIGRTEFDSPEVDNEVLIKADYLRIGDFAEVKITNASEYDLIAEAL